MHYNAQKRGNKPWLALITVNHNRIYLGRYEMQDEAVAARVRGEINYLGFVTSANAPHAERLGIPIADGSTIKYESQLIPARALRPRW